MPTLEQLSDDLWTGRTSTHDPDHHPFVSLNRTEEVANGVAFYKGFSNITVVRTEDGAVLIDTGSFHPVAHKRSFDSIRGYTPERIHTAIYTHGHVDHAYGLPPFLAEAKSKGWIAPAIVGHEAIAPRMNRYIETAGYNAVINERQFSQPIDWPTDPIYPTQTYTTAHEITVGGTVFRIRHAKGETDDHSWVFVPESHVLCTGDLFIWAAPNAGNPQKVQRYIKEWAEALRVMVPLNAHVLLPGHGLPVFGVKRVRQVLEESAEYLETLYRRTVDAMNRGATVDEIIHEVTPPEHLRDRPFLQPIYDEPEFILRNIHRCLGGWYSGIPSELKPAPRASQAKAIADLAGGIDCLIGAAKRHADIGDLRLACHFADWAVEAAPENAAAHRVRADIYDHRTKTETSTMARGVFNAAAKDSRAKADG